MNGQTTRAGEYRRRAEEAERQAQQARDLVAKRAFEEAARYWLQLAELDERHR